MKRIIAVNTKHSKSVLIRIMGKPSSEGKSCVSCHDLDTYSYVRLQLPRLRETAHFGCLYCRIVLASIEKFSDFWLGTGNDQKDWPEDQITVVINTYDCSPEVTVARPKREIGDGTLDINWLELELYSHAGS